jgi:succinyl-CoA synthetase beta subunit
MYDEKFLFPEDPNKELFINIYNREKNFKLILATNISKIFVIIFSIIIMIPEIFLGIVNFKFIKTMVIYMCKLVTITVGKKIYEENNKERKRKWFKEYNNSKY